MKRIQDIIHILIVRHQDYIKNMIVGAFKWMVLFWL